MNQASAPSTPPPPSANVTRADVAVGGTAAAPATTGTGMTGAATLQPSGVPAAPASSGGPGGYFMLVMMVPIALLLLFTFLGQRKENKKRQTLMASLQQHDKVQTIGGMIGSIAELTDHEVVLKTDEVTNSRVRVSRQAIQQVLSRKGEVAKS